MVACPRCKYSIPISNFLFLGKSKFIKCKSCSSWLKVKQEISNAIGGIGGMIGGIIIGWSVFAELDNNLIVPFELMILLAILIFVTSFLISIFFIKVELYKSRKTPRRPQTSTRRQPPTSR